MAIPPSAFLLIAGAPDCFTRGNDLADFAAKPRQVSPAIRYLKTLATSSQLVVAAVAGAAIGIGTTMLLHCDLVYAASARFQLPFVSVGLCPEAASERPVADAREYSPRRRTAAVRREIRRGSGARSGQRESCRRRCGSARYGKGATTGAKTSPSAADDQDASQMWSGRGHQASHIARRRAICGVAREGSKAK